MTRLIPAEITLLSLFAIVIVLVTVWIIVSIPIYLAGKAGTQGKSTLGNALAATLFGPIVYVIVLVVVDFFLGEIIGNGAYIWGYLLAFIAWIWVYKSTLKTGWLGALAIAILAIIIFLIFSIILGVLFSLIMPGPVFPRL